jgi:hypothetical protein
LWVTATVYIDCRPENAEQNAKHDDTTTTNAILILGETASKKEEKKKKKKIPHCGIWGQPQTHAAYYAILVGVSVCMRNKSMSSWKNKGGKRTQPRNRRRYSNSRWINMNHRMQMILRAWIPHHLRALISPPLSVLSSLPFPLPPFPRTTTGP